MQDIIYLYIYFVFLFGNSFVCLYPINVKTAEPIGPIILSGPHMTPGKVYEGSNFQKLASNKRKIVIKF